MKELYERTLRNCEYYEQGKDFKRLLNEIGVLRGIAYCLENNGQCVHDDEKFIHFIEMQNNIINSAFVRVEKR